MRSGSKRIFYDIDPTIASRLNALIESGKDFLLQKEDRKTTVVGIVRGSILDFPCDLCIKRFNYKGFFSFLLKISFGSRAKRLWKISQRLYGSGLPVAQPFACIEPSFRVKHSFFISSAIENSKNLGLMFKENLIDKPGEIARSLAKTLAEWHLSGAVHGDLKWSNILVQKKDEGLKFFLVDLDQTKVYRSPNVKGIRKDLARFYRYGLELNAEGWVVAEFIPAYSESIPDRLKNEINFSDVKNKAKTDWERKGRRLLLHPDR